MLVRKKVVVDNSAFTHSDKSLGDMVTVGLYLANDVLSEVSESYGMGNFLDCILFEMLMNKDFSDTTQITGHTYYLYSEFILSCKPADLETEFLKMVDIIFDEKLTEQNFDHVRKNLKDRLLQNTWDIDNALDEKYYSSRRFCEALVGNWESINQVSFEAMENYKEKYYSVEQSVLCFTNERDHSLIACIEEKDEQPFVPPILCSQTFGKRSAKDDIMVKVDFEDSDVIISFDCELTEEHELLVCELLCCFIEYQLKGQINTEVCLLEKPVIELYYASYRMIFKFTVKNKDVIEQLGNIFSIFIGCINNLTKDSFQKVKEEILENYYDLLGDDFSLNQFLGLNYFAGEIYNITDMIHIKDKLENIHLMELKNLYHKVFTQKNLIVALTNNPQYRDCAEVRKIVEEFRLVLTQV